MWAGFVQSRLTNLSCHTCLVAGRDHGQCQGCQYFTKTISCAISAIGSVGSRGLCPWRGDGGVPRVPIFFSLFPCVLWRGKRGTEGVMGEEQNAEPRLCGEMWATGIDQPNSWRDTFDRPPNLQQTRVGLSARNAGRLCRPTPAALDRPKGTRPHLRHRSNLGASASRERRER
jgi:hypothetical protein